MSGTLPFFGESKPILGLFINQIGYLTLEAQLHHTFLLTRLCIFTQASEMTA